MITNHDLRVDALERRFNISSSSTPLVVVTTSKLAAVNVTPADDTADKLALANVILEVPPVTSLDVPHVPPPRSLKEVDPCVAVTT